MLHGYKVERKPDENVRNRVLLFVHPLLFCDERECISVRILNDWIYINITIQNKDENAFNIRLTHTCYCF